MGYIMKCSALVYDASNNFTSSGNNTLLSFGVINAVLAVPTAAGNALVIVAILTTSSLQTPSYLLLTSLAFSDLAVGLLGQPLLSSLIFTFLIGHTRAFCYLVIIYYAVTSWTSWASIFSITAISVDRYLAIRLKMQYRSVVTVRKTKGFLLFIWILSLGITCFVLAIFEDTTMVGVVGGVLHTICLFVIMFCYTMSYRTLKIHCAQIQPQGNQQPNSTPQYNAIDVLKYRKLLKTMILVMVLTLICYLPLVGVFVFLTATSRSYKSDQFDESKLFLVSFALQVLAGLVSIMTLNSTLNPVIYMTRMTDLRQACTQTLRRIFRWQ